MTEKANKLYKLIQNEYNSSNKNGFNYDLFINKYGYTKEELDIILDELSKYGLIEKWIIDGFELIVED